MEMERRERATYSIGAGRRVRATAVRSPPPNVWGTPGDRRDGGKGPGGRVIASGCANQVLALGAFPTGVGMNR
jgi:hypothetical protein